MRFTRTVYLNALAVNEATFSMAVNTMSLQYYREEAKFLEKLMDENRRIRNRARREGVRL